MLTKYSLNDSAINLESVILLSFTDISVILVDLLFLPVREFIRDQIFLKSFEYVQSPISVIKVDFAFTHLLIYSVP